jgi:hypothetical protein
MGLTRDVGSTKATVRQHTTSIDKREVRCSIRYGWESGGTAACWLR